MQWLAIENERKRKEAKEGEKKTWERERKGWCKGETHIKPRGEERSSLCSLSLLGFSYFSARHYSPGTWCEQRGDCVCVRLGVHIYLCVCVCHMMCILRSYVGGNVCMQHWKHVHASFVSRPSDEILPSENRRLAQTHATLSYSHIQLHTKYSLCTAQFIR